MLRNTKNITFISIYWGANREKTNARLQMVSIFCCSPIAVLDGFCCITLQFVTCQIFSYSFNKVIYRFRNRNRIRGKKEMQNKVESEKVIQTCMKCWAFVFYSFYFILSKRLFTIAKCYHSTTEDGKDGT